MGWTTPKTFASGPLPASDLNTYVRDNTEELYDRISLVGIDSSSTLPVLRSARYGCQVWTSSQNVANASDVAVQFYTEAWDDANYHSSSINPARLTAPVDGTYHVTWWVQFAANATGARSGWIETNGSTEWERVGDIAGSANTPARFGHALYLELSAGDYAILRVSQFSGGTLTCDARMTIMLVARG